MFRTGYFEDKIKYNDPIEAKILCSEVISKAKVEFVALGGECNSEFYDNNRILQSINRMTEKKIQARFLFGPNFDIKSYDLLKLAKEDKIKMRRLKRKCMGDHFKISDSKFIYVAKPHSQLGDDREGYISSSSHNAFKLKKKFEDLWENAEDFNVINMVREASVFPNKYLEDDWLEKNDAKWVENSGFIVKESGTEKVRSANTEEISTLKKKLGILST